MPDSHLGELISISGPSRFLIFMDNFDFFMDILIFSISVKNQKLSVKIRNREGPGILRGTLYFNKKFFRLNHAENCSIRPVNIDGH